MSCHGSRTTPLFQIELNHVVIYDDSDGAPPFRPEASLFVRVWNWELEVVMRLDRKRRRFARVKGYAIYLPFIGEIRRSHGVYPAHQYSGDYTERMDERRRV